MRTVLIFLCNSEVSSPVNNKKGTCMIWYELQCSCKDALDGLLLFCLTGWSRQHRQYGTYRSHHGGNVKDKIKLTQYTNCCYSLACGIQMRTLALSEYHCNCLGKSYIKLNNLVEELFRLSRDSITKINPEVCSAIAKECYNEATVSTYRHQSNGLQ